ncbi:hypothetical protein MOPEL_084_00140 [Mobilicoccus pelagius NBRC 104925]|uniref:GtrA/DPMS transmembrane domain-containing protein n=2 Tax=Mobilicoccus TaxID=984996 RepID=H5UT21_9MICO|nr:hypothetical protein MOPEL_084_00140 [Mobilicoccus pelagius NBRC 104925]
MPRRITLDHLGEMLRFGLVGGSGVFVNLGVYVLLHKLLPQDPESVFLPLPPTDFNIRWVHVLSSAAFVVANAWNFELNRLWTFRAGERASRTRFLHFFAVGLVGLALQLLLVTLLIHPRSPIELPTAVFDGSTGFRTRTYWAQLISIAVVTPLSFLFNRLWTFGQSRVRTAPAHDDAADQARA